MTTPDDAEITRLEAENRDLRSALERRVRWRRVLTLILVVLTSLSVVVASLALWAHQVVFDNERFMATIEPALVDPELHALIGDRASESALEALALEDRITVVLDDVDRYLSEALIDAIEPSAQALALLRRFDRPTLGALAPAIAAALEERIDTAIVDFFTSEGFAARLPGLVSRVHQAAVALARDDMTSLPNVYVEAGEVRLNLIPFIAEALQSVADDLRALLPDFELPAIVSDRVDEGRDQLRAAIGAELPDDFGQITIMSQADLAAVQDAATGIDRLVWLVILVSLVLLVVTIAVSPRRRNTLVHLGIGIVVAVVIAELAVRRIEGAIVDGVRDPRGAGVAAGIVGDALSGLRTAEWLLALAAVAVAAGAYLAGRPAWATRLAASTKEWTDRGEGASRLDVWISARAGLLQVAGIALALIVLFLVGLQPIAVILIALALAAYLWFVATATRRAAPDVPAMAEP